MKSNCCNAPMTAGGDGTGEGATHFWVCERCSEACDPATTETHIGTYQPIGEGVCPVQRVTFDPPIQVRSDQELIIEGDKATVRPITESLQELAQIEINKALKEFNKNNYPYIAILATDVEIVEISRRAEDDLIPETPPIIIPENMHILKNRVS